jgi:lantibiotic modifying enzyme
MQTIVDDDIRRFTEVVFERLWAERVELPRGEYGWISIECDDRSGELILVAHDGIYSGQLGIAMYAAAMHHVLGKQRYADVATTIADVYLSMEQDNRRPIGCSNGLASLAYGYAKLGQLLNDKRYIDHSQVLSHWLTERIESDDSPADVLHGKAGALLVLLSIYELTQSAVILDRARRIGEALIDDAEGAAPTNGWDLDTETGVAHGHAGIAYALYRLAAHSEDEMFRTAADHAIAYENEYYTPETNRWNAAPSDNHPRYAWCNGAAGIGAARAASLRYVQSDILHRDVTRVHEGLSAGLPPNDSLCHGSFSEAVFRHACTESGISDMEQYVIDIASRVISRDRRNGHLQLVFRDRTDLLPTSLFSGIAGVGYMLLRAVAPATIPSVALFD